MIRTLQKAQRQNSLIKSSRSASRKKKKDRKKKLTDGESESESGSGKRAYFFNTQILPNHILKITSYWHSLEIYVDSDGDDEGDGDGDEGEEDDDGEE